MESKLTRIAGRLLCAAATLILAHTPGTAAAQSDRYKGLSLEDILKMPIEVASTTKETIFATPSTVSVIDRETIERYHFTSVAEAVASVAGFDVLRTYLKRGIPTSRGILQEHYANKVLLMINGIPTWHAVTGEASLDRIDINDVERIEVLRGPASVLYGTNAYVGAINIVLALPDRSPAVQMGVGSHGALKAGGRFGRSGSDWSVIGTASAAYELGHRHAFTDERKETGTLREYVRPSDFTVAARKGPHSALFNAYSSHESFLGLTPDFDMGVGNDHWSRGYLANYTFKKEGQKLDISSGLTGDWSQRDFSRTRDDVMRSNVLGYRLGAFAKVRVPIDRSFDLELGADADYRKSLEYTNYDEIKDMVLAENNMEGRHQLEYSFFAQGKFAKDPLTILVGSRITKNEFFGSNVSSRATVVYALNERNSLKAIFGQSFRAPALFELYFQTPTNTTYGNLDLQPETSDSYELAYLTKVGDVFAQVLVYHARYVNKIFRVRRLPNDAKDRSVIYENGNPFEANGLEVELKHDWARRLSGFVNYEYVDGDSGDELDSNPGHYNFRYVSKHVLTAGLAVPIGPLSLSGVVNYRSATEGPKAPIDAATTFDLNAVFTHQVEGFQIRHSVSVKNVGDTDVQVPEYVRRNINAVPLGYGREFLYTVQVSAR